MRKYANYAWYWRFDSFFDSRGLINEANGRK
jgi:hypothetical protein